MLIGGNLTAQSTGSYGGIGGCNSNCRDLVASSPSFSRPSARASRRACAQAGYHSALCPNQLTYLCTQADPVPCCCVVLARVCWRAIWDAQVKCRGIQKGGFRCFWEVKELTSGIQQDTSYTWLHFSGDCYKKHFLLEFLVLFFA